MPNPEIAKLTETGRRALTALIATVLLLGLAVALQQSAPPGLAAGTSPASPADGNAAERGSSWTYLKEQQPAFSLEQTSFSSAPTAHSAYARDDGSRTDWVGAGSLAMASPDMSIMVTRFAEPRPVRETVVKALQDFSELKLAQPQFHATRYALTTRLGALQAVTFDVSADGIGKHCVGFRTPGRTALFVEGFVCSRDRTTVTPQNAACMIDRIRLVRAADQEAVETASASSGPRGCGATPLDPKSETGGDSL